MSEHLLSLAVPAAVVVPLAELRQLCEAMAAIHMAVSDVSARLLERLDDHDGDPDMEPDDFGEDDDPKEREDEDCAAWLERIDQTRPPLPNPDWLPDSRNFEDAEDGHDAELGGR